MKPGNVFLAGASLVLPDRIEAATLVLEGERIVDIVTGPREVGEQESRVDLSGRLIVPGFVDVHVHGGCGTDVLDGPGSVARLAAELPRRGVTAFCPTSVACDPDTLGEFLAEVTSLRQTPPAGARVLAAHLESNFINPAFHGAQPLACLRNVDDVRAAGLADGAMYSGRDVLDVLDRHRADVGIVTLAPEVPGGRELLRALTAGGVRVSLGHTGATFEQAGEAIADGARQVTHLFNRMAPFTHRDPGLVGAALANEDVAVELICDGRHVHPAAMRVALASKGPGQVMAITDGTAGAGLPAGSSARLGGQAITVGDAARLADGTMAGSVLTMDRAFAVLAGECGADLVEAARMCSTTPARVMGLVGHGAIAPGAIADLTVLDARLAVVETWVAGKPVWRAPEAAA